MTKERGADTNALLDGIREMLADDRNGKRSLAWLAKRAGLSHSTLKRRMRRPGDFTSDELYAIADAFGVDIRDLYTTGIASKAAA